MRIGKRFTGALVVGSLAVTSLWGLNNANAADAPSTSAAPAVVEPLFVNLGPVPTGVRVGTLQTVFAFVHAGTPTGPVVSGMPVHFNVVSGPNSGQSGVVNTNDIGQAIYRFKTTGASPTTGGTDVVSVWLDLNGSGALDSGEPATVNPFFTLPALTINGAIACDGRPATQVLQGSSRLAQGTGGPDVIAVFSDGSRVNLGDGDDVVCSWGDKTSVYAANGNDRVLLEGTGNTVYANDGDDFVQTGRGDSLIYAGNGNDRVFVGDGKNTVWGGGGDDHLAAGSGPSQLSGDAGNDTITAFGNTGTYWGGAGFDTFDIAGKKYSS